MLTTQLKIKQKKQKDELISILLGPLGASLLGSLLAVKVVIWACEGTIRAGQDF